MDSVHNQQGSHSAHRRKKEMTKEDIKKKFSDASKIEYCDDGKAFVYFVGSSYPMIIEYEGK